MLNLVYNLGCAPDKNFETPDNLCNADLVATISLEDLKNIYVDGVIEIQEDLVLEAIVISSDKEGNFFSVLHCQDKPINPSGGIQLEVDLQNLHLQYPVGSKVFIKLKGLYLGKSKDTYKIGGLFTSFGNLSVGRLPALSLKEHVFLSCEEQQELEPTVIEIPQISDQLINTLVRFNDVEFLEEELQLTFAEEKEETGRTLQSCDEDILKLVNSGYSNFYDSILPNLNGTITGVLSKSSKDYQLIIRSLDDLNFNKERCVEEITEFTSDAIFISELADPNNTSLGRFVELYNASDSTLVLNKWTLQRYTNGNIEVSSEVNLSGLEVAPQSTIVIAPSADNFNSIYGFLPNLEVGINSPADSNGDDNLILVDPFGKIIDVFGVVGEDGSGTNHEFEDGRAVRKSEVQNGNPVYDFSEWIITNDSGEDGTINNPGVAPESYTPGVHN
ncbi:DUF5689 domain-containing protein [Maribacter vaceletii]|nr:DUF5689 domain-containing protein [Maribacter vaceletii]